MIINSTKLTPSALSVMLFALFIPALLFMPAYAADSGTVHFQGRIVEDGCYTGGLPAAPQVSCYREGQWRSQPVLINTNVQGTLPYHIGTTQFSWIDKNKNLALVTYNYY